MGQSLFSTSEYPDWTQMAQMMRFPDLTQMCSDPTVCVHIPLPLCASVVQASPLILVSFIYFYLTQVAGFLLSLLKVLSWGERIGVIKQVWVCKIQRGGKGCWCWLGRVVVVVVGDKHMCSLCRNRRGGGGGDAGEAGMKEGGGSCSGGGKEGQREGGRGASPSQSAGSPFFSSRDAEGPTDFCT